MAESSWPFDSGAGSASGEDRWYKMAPLWALDGVTASGGLAVTTLSGRNLQVATGEAWVHGAYYVNDAALSVPIAANASGNPRIDRVVLRRDLSANTVVAAVVQGTAAASPTAPALTQSATGIWEVPVARYRAESGFVNTDALKLTDERVLTGPSAIISPYTNMQIQAPNASDFNSGSMSDWLTGFTVPVPTWARDGACFADFLFTANPIIITAAATFAFRLVADTTNGATSGGFQAPGVTTAVPVIAPMSAYAIPVGTATIAVKVQAQRTAGTGGLRLNTANNASATVLTVIRR